MLRGNLKISFVQVGKGPFRCIRAASQSPLLHTCHYQILRTKSSVFPCARCSSCKVIANIHRFCAETFILVTPQKLRRFPNVNLQRKQLISIDMFIVHRRIDLSRYRPSLRITSPHSSIHFSIHLCKIHRRKIHFNRLPCDIFLNYSRQKHVALDDLSKEKPVLGISYMSMSTFTFAPKQKNW